MPKHAVKVLLPKKLSRREREEVPVVFSPSESETSLETNSEADLTSPFSDDSVDSPPPKTHRTRSQAASIEKSRSRSKTQSKEKELRHRDHALQESASTSALHMTRERPRTRTTHEVSKPHNKDPKCTLVLNIHRIRGFENVKYLTDYVSATVVYREEQLKSEQVNREKYDLSEDFCFEWSIPSPLAHSYVETPDTVYGQFMVTIKMERFEEEGKRRWTHVIGTAKLPTDLDKNYTDGRRKCILEGTKLERGMQEVTYSIEVKIGRTKYTVK